MKIYYHPVSTTSRPLMLFARESGIDVDFQVVDLLTGEHMKPEYASINPNRLVPVLEDGDFRLTESSAILRHLAEKTGSPAYPKELRARARVNEMMDWINTQICRDFAYGLVCTRRSSPRTAGRATNSKRERSPGRRIGPRAGSRSWTKS
jgi:glutathione S-transferase